MTHSFCIPLSGRSVLQVAAADSMTFLQSLITNDIHKATQDHAIYACMLTPQGKFLFDFFICRHEEPFWLDCAASRIEDLKKRLAMYKLRSKVDISDISDRYEVIASSEPLPDAAVSFADPRTEKLGFRAIVPRGSIPQWIGTIEDYERLRISLRIPDGEKDLIPEKHFPLHFRMEEINAIDYNKGCYVGQEVTSRTKHLGVIRKSLYTVEGKGPLPPIGTPITSEGRQVGELRSSIGNLGLALLEVEAVENMNPLLAVNISLTIAR